MIHKPISIIDLSLSFPSKICFENFSTRIENGSRIAIIGRNGSGKSSLLNILRDKLKEYGGEVRKPNDLSIGYVEQTIEDYNNLSGGQRLNKKLTTALALSPDLLLLDEPTNHLDQANRKSLMRMLQNYYGTLIIVSHDKELLRTCIDTIWHIDNNKITEFTGRYDDYLNTIKQKRSEIEQELDLLERDKKNMHNKLMREQKRAAKSKAKGQKSIAQRKWPTIVSEAKTSRAEETSGRKKNAIEKNKQELSQKLSELRLPEIIVPKFCLTSDISSGNILTINNADIGYSKDNIILKNISLSLGGKERIAINGKNASGKSTLLKAILNNKNLYITGDWYLPKAEDIGYLDQHYINLDYNNSIIDNLAKIRPDWDRADLRQHLNSFLFRKNEEVDTLVLNLSGGEKARLILSLIAAKPPKLLILDEITNNLDIETKDHITEVLQEYPGAMIIVRTYAKSRHPVA